MTSDIEAHGATAVYRGAVADVPDGGLLEIDAAGQRVLLGRHGSEVFAVSRECTHDGAPLEEGELLVDGAEVSVVCPWHFARFCLRTGAVLESPAEDPLAAYRVAVDGDAFTVSSAAAGSTDLTGPVGGAGEPTR